MRYDGKSNNGKQNFIGDDIVSSLHAADIKSVKSKDNGGNERRRIILFMPHYIDS
jgi:hypothetical protein